MQAVIMAGGKGTRLSSVTKDVPKPMVNFCGRPLLEYQIDNLKECGVTEILLIIGYLGDVIETHFGNGEKYGVNIIYYREQTPLGTAGALYYIREWLKDDFILLFGDLFISIDFTRMIKHHLNYKNAFATLYVHPNSHPFDSDIVVTNDDDRIIDWSYKRDVRKRDYKNLVNAGIYILSKDITDSIKANTKTDLERDVLIPNINNKNIYAYPCTEYVKDIGTPERLNKVEKDYKNGVCSFRNLKNKQKCIFLDRDGTINKYVGFLRDKDQLVLEDGVGEAVRMINQSEYLAIVVTNQPVIARGEVSYEQLEGIHNRLDTLLGEEGAYLDDLYYCPHHPDSGYDGERKELKIECNCRKPGTGLIELASAEHNIDLEKSWIIGDTTTDVQTGINGGLHTALVMTGEKGLDGKYSVTPEITGISLKELIRQIIGGK